MARINSLLALCLLAFPLQLFLLGLTAHRQGLSIKVIHRDSPESPYYPGNIDRNERITRNVQLTASAYDTILWDNSSLDAYGTSKLARPRVGNQGQMYFVEVGIGTFNNTRPPYMNYFLHLDTGGDTMWTQCEECQNRRPGSCFQQKAPLFPAKKSRTYRPLPCNGHRLCIPGKCLDGFCSYFFPYGDGSNTTGYLAQESLTFYADRNRVETVKDFVFGCGIEQRGFRESSKDNLIAGNFGLGAGPRSFIDQQRPITQGRFSYCLPPWNAAKSLGSYFRFGADIPPTGRLRSTALKTAYNVAAYYLVVKDISIRSKRLNFTADTFSLKRDYSGGCVLDSGASVGILPANVYDRLTSTLKNDYFSRHRMANKMLGLDFCFHYPWFRGIRSLPSITFHMEDGADLALGPENAYMEGKASNGKKAFCLGFLRGRPGATTSIGALQQANTRYVFDRPGGKLYFGPENCMRSA